MIRPNSTVLNVGGRKSLNVMNFSPEFRNSWNEVRSATVLATQPMTMPLKSATSVKSVISNARERTWGDVAVVTCWLDQAYTFDGKDAIRQLKFDVFLLQARQLCRHLHLSVGVAHLDIRPPDHAIEPTIKAEGGEIKPAKDVIEQPVHLTVQRQEWIGLLAPNRDIAPPIPRDKISNAHCSLHCVGSLVAWSRHAPRP